MVKTPENPVAEPIQEPVELPNLEIFSHLPEDLWTPVFQQLEVKDLPIVSLVCKAWHKHAGEDLVWEKMFVAKYPKASPINPSASFKENYKLQKAHQAHLDSLPLDAKQMVERLPEFLRMITSKDPAAHLEGTVFIRKMLSLEKNPPIQDVIDANCIPPLVNFLALDANPQLQFEAAWALTNIASGNTSHCTAVMNGGTLPHFVRLMDSPSQDVAEQAVWGLGNIAGDSTTFRDICLTSGVLQGVIKLLRGPMAQKISVLRNSTWTLSNLCRGKPQPALNLVSPALPVLYDLLHSTDQEVITDALWAMSYIADGDDNRITACLNSGAIPQIITLMSNPAPSIQTPALRTIGNIASGNDSVTEYLLLHGALPPLMALLQAPKKGIRKEACWTYSNIMASPKLIQAVIDAGTIPILVTMAATDDHTVRQEAAWCLTNMCSAQVATQIQTLVDNNGIPALLSALEFANPSLKGEICESLLTMSKHAFAHQAINEALTNNRFIELFQDADEDRFTAVLSNIGSQAQVGKVKSPKGASRKPKK